MVGCKSVLEALVQHSSDLRSERKRKVWPNSGGLKMDELDGPKEACKTYIEQTKLLVTLASAFVVAPAAIAAFFVGKDTIPATAEMVLRLLWAEGFFVGSVLTGYLILASIAGSQQANIFDVYRPATRILSWLQIGAYIIGLIFFVSFLRLVISSRTPLK
jgi:hypothetical protein